MEKEKNKKTKSKKRIITITIVGVFLILIVTVLGKIGYACFWPKSYSYYTSGEIKDIQSVSLYWHDEKNNEESGIRIYDGEVVETFVKELEKMKFAPCITEEDTEENLTGKGFNIQFNGADNREYHFSASEIRNKDYIIGISRWDNGELVETEDEWLVYIPYTYIDEEEGEFLYNLVHDTIKENEKNITVEDVLKISEEKDYDWNKFKQFISIDETDNQTVKTRDGKQSEEVERFQIDNKEGYILVWSCEGEIHSKEGVEIYSLVCDAIVYNEHGEEMNLYDEGIATFLEKMK